MANIEVRKVIELREWDLNPRDIDEKAYGRLKDQISLKGQFAPLLIMPDGLVLGGNMRLKAMLELGIEEAWVTTVDFIQEGDLFYAMYEDERGKESFPTKEDAMMNWSIAHNAQYGHYDEDKFANLEGNYDIDWSQFAVDFEEPQTIQDFIDNVAPEGDTEFKHQVIIICKDESQQGELFSELTNEGYDVKTKTTIRRKK